MACRTESSLSCQVITGSSSPAEAVRQIPSVGTLGLKLLGDLTGDLATIHGLGLRT